MDADKIKALMKEAAAAHHEASLAQNAKHEDWAGWYANYLADRLREEAGFEIDEATLEQELVAADIEHRSHEDDHGWPRCYTDLLVRKFGS